MERATEPRGPAGSKLFVDYWKLSWWDFKFYEPSAEYI